MRRVEGEAGQGAHATPNRWGSSNEEREGGGKGRIGPFVCDPKDLRSSSNGKMGDGGGEGRKGGKDAGKGTYPAQWSSRLGRGAFKWGKEGRRGGGGGEGKGEEKKRGRGRNEGQGSER